MEKTKKLTIWLSIAWLAVYVVLGTVGMVYMFRLFKFGPVAEIHSLALWLGGIVLAVLVPPLFVIHRLAGKTGPRAIRIISKVAIIFLSAWGVLCLAGAAIMML